jgi:hypothetical protein
MIWRQLAPLFETMSWGRTSSPVSMKTTTLCTLPLSHILSLFLQASYTLSCLASNNIFSFSRVAPPDTTLQRALLPGAAACPGVMVAALVDVVVLVALHTVASPTNARFVSRSGIRRPRGGTASMKSTFLSNAIRLLPLDMVPTITGTPTPTPRIISLVSLTSLPCTMPIMTPIRSTQQME